MILFLISVITHIWNNGQSDKEEKKDKEKNPKKISKKAGDEVAQRLYNLAKQDIEQAMLHRMERDNNTKGNSQDSMQGFGNNSMSIRQLQRMIQENEEKRRQMRQVSDVKIDWN